MAFSHKTYRSNPARSGMARLLDGILYSSNGDPKTKLSLLRPWEKSARYPLVVFVQGSSWTTPNLGYEIPQLSHLAQQGYVVATVSHRDVKESNPFPAFLQDVKTAIRYLRAHADTYCIDPTRVCIYGTSSGGNTAMLVGATGDDPRYKTEEYADQSDAVNCVVSCFGRMDLTKLPKMQNPLGEIFLSLIGTGDAATVLKAMSPYHAINKDTPFPPCLIAHGTGDQIVPYDLAEMMAEKLKQLGKEVRLLTVTDAPHEDTFWSWPLIEDIYAFIKAHI